MSFARALPLLVISLTLSACGDGDDPPASSSLCAEGVGDALLSSRQVAFPRARLGREAVFGGTITAVSDHEHEDIGDYKVWSTTPYTVTPKLSRDGSKLELWACTERCVAGTPPQLVYQFEVVDEACGGDLLVLDGLGLANTLQVPEVIAWSWDSLVDQRATRVEANASLRAELDADTWLFDGETTLSMSSEPYPEDPARAPRKDVRMRTRWFLRDVAAIGTGFAGVAPTPGLGFFKTWRRRDEAVNRWRFDSGRTVTYYVKNLPKAYEDELAQAFQGWNDVFEGAIGHAPLRFEVLAPGDPRNETIGLGDPRYSIFEWDVTDRASYGGVGQSLYDERSGEILNGNILIQGPLLESLYRDWFSVAAAAAREGDTLRAERVAQAGLRKLKRRMPPRKTGPRVPGKPSEDPLPRFDFDLPPTGYDYDSFFSGLLVEIFQHELGHTLGLTHNFMGSMEADEARPSNSVMEYVTRVERARTRIGPYDKTAIAYAYAHRIADEDWAFCDDSGVNYGAPDLSPECLPNDASSDPFTFLREKRVRRAFDLLVGRGADVPSWAYADLSEPLHDGLQGMAVYAVAAAETSSTWRGFHAATRPAQPADIADYVVEQIAATICDPGIEEALTALEGRNAEAAAQARAEVDLARASAVDMGTWLDLSIEAPCLTTQE